MVDHVQLLIFRIVDDVFNDVRVVVGNVFVRYHRAVRSVALDRRAGHVREVLVWVPGGVGYQLGHVIDGLGAAKVDCVLYLRWRL